MREIESKCIYGRISNFADSKSFRILSCQYTEKFLKEIGHTPEEFVTFVKEHGLPTLFETETPARYEVAKRFIECEMLTGPNSV